MGQRREQKYDDGSRYEGGWNDAGEKNGVGTLNFTDKTKYQGQLKDGLFDGYGVLEITDQSNGSVHIYQGQFTKGKFNGCGVFTQGDKMKYEGQFKDGKISGSGKITFKDGSNGLPRYEGVFENGTLIETKSCSTVVEEANKSANLAKQQKQ